MCLFRVSLIHAIVASLFMPDHPRRMSIRSSVPTCYLQDRDEIADDVIIVKSRNRYVKVTVISVHPLTVPSGINPRATVASIKVLFSGHKRLNLHSFCPLLRLGSRHFALLEAVFQPYTGQFTNFLTPRHRKRCIYA